MRNSKELRGNVKVEVWGMISLRRRSVLRFAVFCALALGLALGEWCFFGRWMWLRHRGVRLRVLHQSRVFCDKSSADIAILVDGSVLRKCRNHSNRVVWCKVHAALRDMILSLFVAGAVLCVGFVVWKRDFRGRREES